MRCAWMGGEQAALSGKQEGSCLWGPLMPLGTGHLGLSSQRKRLGFPWAQSSPKCHQEVTGALVEGASTLKGQAGHFCSTSPLGFSNGDVGGLVPLGGHRRLFLTWDQSLGFLASDAKIHPTTGTIPPCPSVLVAGATAWWHGVPD